MLYTFHLSNGLRHYANLSDTPIALREKLEVRHSESKYIVIGDCILRLDQIVMIEADPDPE